MKLLVKLARGLGVLIALLVAISFFLPSQTSVERTRVVKAPPERIWPLVSEPRSWSKWSPWFARDPRMSIEFSGPTAGAGASWKWDSKTEGRGSMKFEQADPGKRLDYSMHFEDMNSRAKGRIVLEPAGGGTRVTWAFTTEPSLNPINRYFGLLLDRLVGPDFEAGLAGIEKAATATP